jgi:hypothetical protein
VRREAAEGGGAQGRGVEQQPAARRRRPRRQDVEQRRLAGAAGTHHGQDLPRPRCERHVAEDVVRGRRRHAARLQEPGQRPRRGYRLRVVDVPSDELVGGLLGRWRSVGIVGFRDRSGGGGGGHCSEVEEEIEEVMDEVKKGGRGNVCTSRVRYGVHLLGNDIIFFLWISWTGD